MTWVQFISDQTLDTYIAKRLHVHPSKKYAPFLVRVAVAACLSYIIHFGKLILFFIEFELSKVSSQRSTSCCRKLWFVAVSVQKNWANLPIINKSYWSSSGKQSSNQYLIQLRIVLLFSFSIVICIEKEKQVY